MYLNYSLLFHKLSHSILQYLLLGVLAVLQYVRSSTKTMSGSFPIRISMGKTKGKHTFLKAFNKAPVSEDWEQQSNGCKASNYIS